MKLKCISVLVLLVALTAKSGSLSVTPTAPSGAFASSWTFAWDPVANCTDGTSCGVLGYNIYRSQISGTYTTPLASVLTSSAPTYQLSGLARGTYYFVVTAYNADGESSYSNEISIVVKKNPSAPANLRVTSP